MRLGANLHKKSGYFRNSMTRFEDAEKKNGDQYLIMIVWNKNQ